MSAAVVRLVLMRHGETEWSRDGRHTGLTDIPLTDVGEAQARAAAPAIAALKLRDPLVITSPRKRAIRTAELAGLHADRTWDDLSEWDYGDYEGLTTPEICERVPNWTVWTNPCANGESAEDVQTRADLVLSTVAPILPDRDVVLIGHGHFSRCLVARWAKFPVTAGQRFGMSAAGYSVLGYEHGAEQIVHHNIAPELA
ncbi:acid phosphatase [Antrihabitans cavernicola]|nr:acid phosphatase [Spelaeibacter cavernicola]